MIFVVETNFMHGKHMIVFLTSQENPQSQLMIPFQSTNCYDFTMKILFIKMISFKTKDTFLITLFWNYFWHPEVIKKIYVKLKMYNRFSTDKIRLPKFLLYQLKARAVLIGAWLMISSLCSKSCVFCYWINFHI